MTSTSAADTDLRRAVARAVRAACAAAAEERCDAARMDGLCWEGAWEIALAAIRDLDIEAVVRGCERAAGVAADRESAGPA